jgi:hypothetical protein
MKQMIAVLVMKLSLETRRANISYRNYPKKLQKTWILAGDFKCKKKEL